ncbi:hypothetical protein HDC90_000095 [Pedobacter sp. AK013]|nr:glycosyltransferase [Pedobacter sp. AK013]MBB6235498.1 hypothetical protein [Pedobacter sp. AK013]
MKQPPLPSYHEYRMLFLQQGTTYTLTPISTSKNGLLIDLPNTTNLTGWPWDVEVNPKAYDARVSWPKITVVSPSYNQSIYLEETLRSVLLQNYPNLEYIVMDGFSSDNSKDH